MNGNVLSLDIGDETAYYWIQTQTHTFIDNIHIHIYMYTYIYIYTYSPVHNYDDIEVDIGDVNTGVIENNMYCRLYTVYPNRKKSNGQNVTLYSHKPT